MANRKSFNFSPVDAAWLHMESPTNTAMITGVFMFDRPIDWKLFKETVECRMLVYDRFKMRVREPLLGVGTPRWELDPHFSIDSHVHRVALPAPGGQKELQELVGDLMSTELDFSRPLWHSHLVEGFGSGCAVVTRLHHCIADGLALMQVLLSMTDCEPDAPLAAAHVPQQSKSRVNNLFKPAVQAVNRTVDTAETLLHEGLETIVDPGRVLDAAMLGVSGTRAFGKLLFTPPDRKTLFRGKCGIPKHAAWTEPLKIQDVKAVGKAFDGTINDVLITCLAGGLRRYLLAHGQEMTGLNIRAMVPVNLRKPDEVDELGNRFGLVILSLPVGVADPLKRLRILKKRMDAIKNSPEAVVAFGLLGGMGLSPIQVEKALLKFFAAKVSGVMTNVPGPRETLYYCRQPIKGMMFWVPTPGNRSRGTSIISYNGQVIVGVATDAGLVPDPESIVDGFQAEFEAMQKYVRPTHAVHVPVEMEPTPEPVPSNGKERATGHTPAMCQALTRSGKPCKNRALPGQKTCARHSHQHEPAVPA